MCFLSVRTFVQCNQVTGSVWGWFVLMGSEQNMDRGRRSLLLLLLSAWQSRGGAGQVSQVETRSRGCCAWVGSPQQPLPAASPWAQRQGLAGIRAWLSISGWRKSGGRPARSQLLPGVKYHGISLGPAQTLFSYEPGWDLTHNPIESPWDLTRL